MDAAGYALAAKRESEQPAAAISNAGTSESRFIASADAACTACGGSGHRDDQQPAAREAEPELDAHDPASGELAAQWLHRNGLHELAVVVRTQIDMLAQDAEISPNQDDTREARG